MTTVNVNYVVLSSNWLRLSWLSGYYRVKIFYQMSVTKNRIPFRT